MRQIWVIAQNTIKALIRKKDFYVFFMMLIVLLVFLYSENFFGISDISRYIKDIGFFCVWLFSLIIAVTFSAKQLPEEIDLKTIYPLLAKPLSRTHLLFGRFLGSLLASSLTFTIFYLIYILVVYLKGGSILLSLSTQAYVLGICFLSLACSISILFSLYITVSACITLSFIIYFSIMWFIDGLRAIIISSQGWSAVLPNIVYYLIPHYEFYDLRIRLTHSWEALPLWIICVMILYTILYTSCVLYISFFNIRKRSF